MDLRYIFAVQCHNTQTWWPRPPTSSFRRVDSLQILFESYWAFSLLSLCLIWEGTCIGFSDDFLFLQCQVPRTTPCLLSILSPPISKHLFYAHKFKFSSKRNSVLSKIVRFGSLVFQAGISAPWAEYLGGRLIRAQFGRIIRPAWRQRI
jgi:hypothetical protein